MTFATKRAAQRSLFPRVSAKCGAIKAEGERRDAEYERFKRGGR